MKTIKKRPNKNMTMLSMGKWKVRIHLEQKRKAKGSFSQLNWYLVVLKSSNPKEPERNGGGIKIKVNLISILSMLTPYGIKTQGKVTF